jgi:hypothetical protein
MFSRDFRRGRQLPPDLRIRLPLNGDNEEDGK